MSVHLGSQLHTSNNNTNPNKPMPTPVQLGGSYKASPSPSESSQSVRSKLRESLAHSLALVCTSRPSPDSTGGDNKGGDVVQFNYVLLDEDVPFAKDELLQGNGLCWVSDLQLQDQTPSKRPKLLHQHQPLPSPQILATRIEAELFRLYAGVNKKYKEKGRSLLFNLKDRNNPQLRERVMSGDIAPERLCSMTAEELASKELSEWRIAKAEEFAQMVVLPDSDVDVRRLVKKTHKGEFQVEFEQDDGATLEVATGDHSLFQLTQKGNKMGAPDAPKSSDTETSEDEMHVKVNSDSQNLPTGLTALPDDGTDLMQGLMVDELKDTDLPPIVSLDEFMESLDSEPPFENLPIDSRKTNPNSDVVKDNSQVGSKLGSSDVGSIVTIDDDPEKHEKPELKYTRLDMDVKNNYVDEEPGTSTNFSTHKQDSNPNYVHGVSEKSTDTTTTTATATTFTTTTTTTTKQEHIWEGLLQLNISSVVTVIGNYKSGERTSAKEWTSFLDVKGRVRLDAFEKFLQEIPMSRSRAIMVVHFCWKEGSPESGRTILSEVVDSYVADQRVGFAEPAPGVELYLCPPRGTVEEMLGKYIFKDHMETLDAISDGLIGIVVWRKAHVTSTTSPNSSSHHRHNTRKQHYASARRQHEKMSNTNILKGTPLPQEPHPPNPENCLEEPIDDIPPGFGPAAVAARDEDDLPEFDFAGGSNPSVAQFSAIITPIKPINAPLQTPVLPPSRPADQMRELIHKYGGGEINNGSGGVDDDDDDIPEWQPQSLNQPIRHPRQQMLPSALTSSLPLPLPLPPPPPPPRPPQLGHSFQQASLAVQMMNQPQQHFPPVQQFLQYPPNQQPIQQMQTANMMMQNAIHPWQQTVGWPPLMGPPLVQQGNTIFGGQLPPGGFIGSQSGGEWRFDVNNSNGRGY